MVRVAPTATQENSENSTFDESHYLCNKRGYARKDSKEALITGLYAMDEIGRKRARDMVDAMGTLDGPIEVFRGRSRAGARPLAFVSHRKVVADPAAWWDPNMRNKWGALGASPLEGVDATISACTADQCERSSGQELLPDEARGHAAQVRAAKGRELSEWGKFEVFLPVKNGCPREFLEDSR